MFSPINNLLYHVVASVLECYSYNCANPSQALLILLLWWLSPISAQPTATLWEGKSTYGKADMVYACEHITYFARSFDVHYTWDTPIQEFWISFNDRVQQVIINRILLKWSTTRYNQTWENTAIKRLAQRTKRRRSQNIDLVKTKTTWSGLQNRWSRKPE